MKSSVIISVLLFCIYGAADGQTTEPLTAVLEPEQGFNASLGSTVTFSCTVTGTQQVLFSADDNINAAELEARNINALPDEEQPDGSVIGRLEVQATTQNDGVKIMCSAIRLPVISTSTVATLRVQGLLSAPTGLTLTEQTGSNRLNWEAPFTLDLTDIEPDIMHYTVCYSIMNVESCTTVAETEFVFVNLRMDIEFSVSAVNVVGPGDASTISHIACDSSTAPSSVNTDAVTTAVSLQDGPTVSLSFQADEQLTSTNCYDLYRVQAVPSNQGSQVDSGVLLPVISDGAITLEVASGLEANTVYNTTIMTVNTNGEADSTGLLQFSTYDVQAIASSTGAGLISITCTFATGSEAFSSEVTVCVVSEGTISSDCTVLSIPRNPASDVSTQQLTGLSVGVYAITRVAAIFSSGPSADVVHTVEDLAILGLGEIEVTIPPPPTTQPLPTVFTIDPSVGLSPQENVAVIAGSVVGAVIVAALILILIIATVMYVRSCYNQESGKQESATLTTTEMWLEETDGGSNGRAKRLTQSGDSPPLANSLGPLSDMAVIQGRNGAHVEIDLTDSNLPDELQLDSVELTESQPTDNMEHKYTVNSQPPAYESLSQTQPDILKHRGSEIIFHSQPDTTNLDRLTPDDVHEVKLATSMNSIGRRPEHGHSRSLSHDLIGTQSVESITSQGQYAEIEHRSGKKRSKKPKDNDLVMYSEINVSELTPAVPQKKRSRSALASSDSLRSSEPIETFHV